MCNDPRRLQAEQQWRGEPLLQQARGVAWGEPHVTREAVQHRVGLDEGPRHWCPTPALESTPAVIEQPVHDLVVNRGLAGGHEHAGFRHEPCSPAGGDELEPGTVPRDVHGRAWMQP